ncbi:MFS transporter [soil metagenome]
MSDAPTKQPPKENPFLSLALNVALPAIILSQLSKDGRLGPLWALIIAISLPIGYAVYDAILRKKLSFFAVIGFISVLLTGGLGLFPSKPLYFALKEATIPLVFGAAILVTHATKRPLIRLLLWNPEILDTAKVETKLAADGHTGAFEKLLFRSSLLLAAGLLTSGIANFFISMHLLRGTVGGTTAFMEAVGTQTWLTWFVIGLPLMALMMFALWRLAKGIENLTGLTLDDLMYGEPKAVQVTRE